MMTLDLPFLPDPEGHFLLSINESPALQFNTASDALSYAVRLAQQREQQGLAYAINVEGGDGKWRIFQGLARQSA